MPGFCQSLPGSPCLLSTSSPLLPLLPPPWAALSLLAAFSLLTSDKHKGFCCLCSLGRLRGAKSQSLALGLLHLSPAPHRSGGFKGFVSPQNLFSPFPPLMSLLKVTPVDKTLCLSPGARLGGFSCCVELGAEGELTETPG